VLWNDVLACGLRSRSLGVMFLSVDGCLGGSELCFGLWIEV